MQKVIAKKVCKNVGKRLPIWLLLGSKSDTFLQNKGVKRDPGHPRVPKGAQSAPRASKVAKKWRKSEEKVTQYFKYTDETVTNNYKTVRPKWYKSDPTSGQRQQNVWP